jgi:DNA-binding phage protein
MENLKNKHWTAASVNAFVYRIASDFIVQLEKKLDKDGTNHKELAVKAGVTDGRLSQVFNNPGNLTLKSTVHYAQAVGMKVALVAYEDGDTENNNGPINSEIFSACWKAVGSPHDFFELASLPVGCLHEDQYQTTSDVVPYFRWRIGTPQRVAANTIIRGPVN